MAQHSKSVSAMISANTKYAPVLELTRRGRKCVEWRGAKNDKGYGQRSIGGKRYYVHRLVWEAANGPIPKGLCVLHRCDNPPCFNPDHLFLGTKNDNSQDQRSKGRFCTTRKLDAADIPLIRKRLNDGEWQLDIAIDYGVSASNISAIKCGRAWSWIF